MSDWWLTFYDDTFAEFIFEQNPQTENDVEKLINLLDLKEGDRILDQCCGIGRLSVPLANKGFDVIGIDVITSYIERAQSLKSNAQFLVKDALKYIATPKCNAAFNWHTSFGYCLEDERNKAMLQCAFNSLKGGGKFVLDYPNMAKVIREFKPYMKQFVKTDSNSCTIERTSELDLSNGALKQEWVFSFENKSPIKRSGITRLYLPYQIEAMLTNVGFTNTRLFGDANKTELELDSDRCIALAQRPI